MPISEDQAFLVARSNAVDRAGGSGDGGAAVSSCGVLRCLASWFSA